MVSDLIDVPTVRQRALPITVEQYHALWQQGLLPEKVELLEGVLVEKMPKSPLHVYLVLLLLELLKKTLGDDLHVRPEQPITCRRSEPEPDLAVVCGKAVDYLQGHPKTAELVVEIAVSSADIDRRKAAIYAGAGMREYWIVLPEIQQIEVHSKPVKSKYTVRRVFSEGQTAFSEVLPAFRVELSGLFPR